jgi:hypothetical protein
MLTRPGRLAIWVGAGVIIVVGAPIAYAADGGVRPDRPAGCTDLADLAPHGAGAWNRASRAATFSPPLVDRAPAGQGNGSACGSTQKEPVF